LPKNFQILLVEDGDSDALLIERALRTAGIANPIYRARDERKRSPFSIWQQGELTRWQELIPSHSESSFSI